VWSTIVAVLGIAARASTSAGLVGAGASDGLVGAAAGAASSGAAPTGGSGDRATARIGSGTISRIDGAMGRFEGVDGAALAPGVGVRSGDGARSDSDFVWGFLVRPRLLISDSCRLQRQR
jgi:hypothetical protein